MEETISKWNDSYSVGISLIDEQHRELFSMIDTLYRGCFQKNKKTAQEFFEQNIHDMVEYIKCHFSTEEKLLEFIGYPKLRGHKQQHAEFLKKIIPYAGASKTGEDSSFQPYVQYIRDWLFSHVSVSDKDYGIFLRALKQRSFRKNESRKGKVVMAE